MNIINTGNGNTIQVGKGSRVVANSSGVRINDKFVPLKKGMRGSNITVLDGEVYIDGHYLTSEGKWKRNLKSLWHYFF